MKIRSRFYRANYFYTVFWAPLDLLPSRNLPQQNTAWHVLSMHLPMDFLKRKKWSKLLSSFKAPNVIILNEEMLISGYKNWRIFQTFTFNSLMLKHTFTDLIVLSQWETTSKSKFDLNLKLLLNVRLRINICPVPLLLSTTLPCLWIMNGPCDAQTKTRPGRPPKKA